MLLPVGRDNGRGLVRALGLSVSEAGPRVPHIYINGDLFVAILIFAKYGNFVQLESLRVINNHDYSQLTVIPNDSRVLSDDVGKKAELVGCSRKPNS